MTRSFALIAALALLSGCASTYVTPAAGVSLAEFDDPDLRTLYEREPASPFPVHLAMLRVQDSGTYFYDSNGSPRIRYAFITTRDIESEDAVERLRNMPLVDGLAPIGRILLPATAESLDDLRAPAARLRADMILVYTVNTKFSIDGKTVSPLTVISLGFISKRTAEVTTTVAGAVIDVRSGFIYGTTEATVVEEQSGTVWATEEIISQARKRAERQAFEDFIGEVDELWTGILNAHAAASLNRTVADPTT